MEEKVPMARYKMDLTEEEALDVFKRRYYNAKGRKKYIPVYFFILSIIASISAVLITENIFLACFILAPFLVYNIIKGSRERDKINQLFSEEMSQ